MAKIVWAPLLSPLFLLLLYVPLQSLTTSSKCFSMKRSSSVSFSFSRRAISMCSTRILYVRMNNGLKRRYNQSKLIFFFLFLFAWAAQRIGYHSPSCSRQPRQREQQTKDRPFNPLAILGISLVQYKKILI